MNGGGSGIRTHEPFRVSGFQDRCNKPLYHPPIGKASNADLWSIDNHISSKACFRQHGKMPKGSHFVQSSSPFLKQLTDREVLKY